MIYRDGDIVENFYHIEENPNFNSYYKQNILFAKNIKELKKVVFKIRDKNEFSRDESEAVINLPKHNNLAYCYWIKIIDDALWIAYEYVAGTPLNNYWEWGERKTAIA